MGRKMLSINKDVVTEIRKERELGKNYYRNSPNTPRPGRQAGDTTRSINVFVRYANDTNER